MRKPNAAKRSVSRCGRRRKPDRGRGLGALVRLIARGQAPIIKARDEDSERELGPFPGT
jgi:hypothetical protein